MPETSEGSKYKFISKWKDMELEDKDCKWNDFIALSPDTINNLNNYFSDIKKSALFRTILE